MVLFAIAGLELLVPLALAAQPGPGTPSVVRVYSLKFRKAEDAATAVRPLLTGEGTVLIQPKTNSVTVQDQPEAIDRISRLLTRWDIPPRGRILAITLLRATATPVRAGEKKPLPDDVKTVADRLRKLFNFQEFSPVDSVVVRGLEGSGVSCVLQGGYQLDFTLETTAGDNLVKLRDLSLSAVRKKDGTEKREQILKSSINMPSGQPYVLGVGKDEAAQAALFLVFSTPAPGAGPGPGFGGER
ncbi:MAG: hypothetical protein IT186_10585 [Acidobacteria bacterium]|nr:hypothetical protein [Acidobacteriota bacterium]MCG3191643.1 hypothetical protein [Thermoanaerobaculia bacterium]MCK6683935.1 hypothetical protein [Thermoanaerobaculia bacterium]